jgi:hypothetical protein
MDIVLKVVVSVGAGLLAAAVMYGLALYWRRRDGEISLREGRRRMLASIRDHVAELSRTAAQLNLIDVAEDIRSGWPTAVMVVVEIDHTERPAELVITAIRDAAGDILWPPAGAERWMESMWLASASHTVVAQGLANAYEWHPSSLGEPVDECEGFEEFHIALDRFPS